MVYIYYTGKGYVFRTSMCEWGERPTEKIDNCTPFNDKVFKALVDFSSRHCCVRGVVNRGFFRIIKNNDIYQQFMLYMVSNDIEYKIMTEDL